MACACACVCTLSTVAAAERAWKRGCSFESPRLCRCASRCVRDATVPANTSAARGRRWMGASRLVSRARIRLVRPPSPTRRLRLALATHAPCIPLRCLRFGPVAWGDGDPSLLFHHPGRAHHLTCPAQPRAACGLRALEPAVREASRRARAVLYVGGRSRSPACALLFHPRQASDAHSGRTA